MCRLRHLESRIHREVFDTNLPSAHDDETIERFRHELEAWRLGVWASLDSQTDGPNYSLYDTREFFEIQYSKALRMLLQPRITGDRGDSSQTAFYLSLSARAAGDVCQCYKTLHQRRRLGWNLLALHSIFTAGLTLLYCAWARREQVPDLAALEDIRACSNVLFAISEQWPSTQRFRDAFETLARRMMEIVSTSHPAASTQGLSAVEMAPNDDNFWSIFDDLVDDEFIRNQFWFDNTC
ncbi:hypothetical protein N7510_002820 [Penicillium lagena]|uniref:uncharacterized protein n=1 Tax=Penicillium lagena TaxID=94218 RepID=UPI002540EA74|nr:uncharacterized protein N7510_002820 [Penicillium lagena]KAJ5618836.1 hypothetical protein N7510_002820 [Penicillium lagena]